MHRHEKPEPISGDEPKENTENFITKENLDRYVSETLQKLLNEGVIEWKR